MIKKKKSLRSLFQKKIEIFSDNIDAFLDVQETVHNFNANKKDKKSDNDYFRVNQTNIKCYNCHDKKHITRHCFHSVMLIET